MSHMTGEPVAVIADWLTVREAAAQLNLSATRVYQLISAQRITAKRNRFGRYELDPQSVAAYRPLRPRKMAA